MGERKCCKSCGRTFVLPSLLWPGSGSGLCQDCYAREWNARHPLHLDGKEYGRTGLRALLLAIENWRVWSDGTIRIGRSVLRSGVELPKKTKRKLLKYSRRPRVLRIEKLNLKEEKE